MSPPAGSSDHAPKWATQWPTDAVADSSAGRHRRFAGHDRIRSSSSLQRSSWPQPFRPLGPADFAHSGAPKPPCSRFDAHRTPPGRVRRRAVPEPAIFSAIAPESCPSSPASVADQAARIFSQHSRTPARAGTWSASRSQIPMRCVSRTLSRHTREPLKKQRRAKAQCMPTCPHAPSAERVEQAETHPRCSSHELI